jgi:hypothetical protein
MTTDKTMGERFPRTWGRWPRTSFLVVLGAAVAACSLLVFLAAWTLSLSALGFCGFELALVFTWALVSDFREYRRFGRCTICGARLWSHDTTVTRDDGARAHLACPKRELP